MRYFTIAPDLADQSGVYQIRNTRTGAVYIGSTTKPFRHRCYRHEFDLIRRRHPCAALRAAWRLGLPGDFVFEVLELVTGATREREQAWLDRTHADGTHIYNYLRAWRNDRPAERISEELGQFFPDPLS